MIKETSGVLREEVQDKYYLKKPCQLPNAITRRTFAK